MRHRFIYLLFISVMVLFWPSPAPAQQITVSLQANALYEGTSKYGEWLPIVVQLENRGSDRRGRVQGHVLGNQTVNYAQKVELPRGARKEVTIFVVPNNNSRRVVVEFVEEPSEEVVAKQEVIIRPQPNVRFMAAAITAGNDTLDTLTGINFRGERQNDRAVFVPLRLDTLPERPEALRTLDLLVLTGIDTSSLTPRQQQALEQYVALGGMLVLGGGPDAKRVLSGIPPSLHPVSITGEVQLDELPSLKQFTGESVKVNGPFPAAQSELHPQATLRLTEGDLPMIIEREIGHGIVYWLALDPALTPFDAWRGAENFWLNVVGSRAIYPFELPPDIAPRQLINNDLFYALQNLPVLDLPSLRLLLPLLFLYILVLGPINYFLLRRRKRLELAWVTVPLITIFFSIGVYGVGYYLRGSDVVLNQITIVQAIPQSNHAYLRSMVGLFSPSSQTYNLSVSEETLLSPLQQSFDFPDNSASNYDATFIQGTPAMAKEIAVTQWSMKSLMAESLLTGGYEFDSDLQIKNQQVRGTITNQSDQMWEEVAVVFGNQFTKLGDIAPNTSQEVTLPIRQDQQFNPSDITWQLIDNTFDNSETSRRNETRRQVLSSLYNNQYSLQGIGQINHSAPMLLAWTNQAPNPVTLSPADRRAPTSIATTLLYAELPLSFAAGEVSLSRGTIPSRLIEHDGSYCYLGRTSLDLNFRKAVIQFELPNDLIHIDPSELSIYIETDGGGFASPNLSLYDYDKEAWVEIKKGVLGRNKIAEPDVYLNENGLFLLQIEQERNNSGGCLLFDAALEGELK